MKEGIISRRYAKGLFSALIQGSSDQAKDYTELKRAQEDLNSLQNLFENETEINNFFLNPKFSPPQKIAILEKTLHSKVHITTLNGLKFLLKKDRFTLFKGICQEFTKTVEDHFKITRAEITVKFPLTTEQEKELLEKLKKKTGALEIRPHIHINPNLLGGIIIRIGDLLIDGSLENQLGAFKKRLLAL